MTTRRNYKHIPQIVCISSRFRVLHLLSWEFERSEVLWRYTVILVCHLKHVEVGWATRNYVRCHDGVTLYFSYNSNLYDSRENHHKVGILNYSVSLQYSKRNRDFITINFQGVFHVLERYIGFEPLDLFHLTKKCYRKCLQNFKGTIFGVAWTEKYRFEIINVVTDEPKGTIFSVISLIISTD